MLRVAAPIVAVAPTFSAFMTTTQTVTTGIESRAVLDTVEVNLGGAYNTTFSRYTPSVAGYYQINISGRAGGTSVTAAWFFVKKNSSTTSWRLIDGGAGYTNSGSVLILMNGTTDYIELWGVVTGTTPTFEVDGGSPVGSNCPRMSAFLARAT